jgi:hypothetical protein
MEMILNNSGPRYLLYLIGLSMMVSSVIWQTPFISKPSEQSQTYAALYATIAFPLFIIGLSMILLPALAGKAEVFRFIFASETWTIFSHSSLGLYYSSPIISLFYFMTSQHQINVSYYMFVYYFAGNFVFGLVLNLTVIHWIDRPIYAMINLRDDIKDAEMSKLYRLRKYTELFTGQIEPSEESSVVSMTEEEIQEHLLQKGVKDHRFDSGATAAGSNTGDRETAATTRPTAFGTIPGSKVTRTDEDASLSMRFSMD